MRAWLLWVALAVGVAACGTTFALRHRVQQGETVASIAGLYGMSEREVREFNRLEPGDRLRPGDIVFVPGAAVRREPERPAGVAREVPSGPPVAEAGRTRLPARPDLAPPPPAQRPPRASVPAPAAAPPPVPARAGSGKGLRWPVEGEVLRGFGTGPTGESRGIDIGAPAGTAVRAAAPGTVTYAGTPASVYGPLVILEHEGNLFTVYGNLREFRVEKGQRIEGGQTIGASGSRDAALPPHVHFEVRRGQDPVDPLLYLPLP